MTDDVMTPATQETDAFLTLPNLKADCLNLFYGVLFYPVRTFRLIAAEPHPGNRLLFLALVTVLLISTLAPIVAISGAGGKIGSLALAMPFSAFSGLLVWGFVGLVIGLLSYAFTGKTRLLTFLTLSGLATLPWIFVGPISLLKIGVGGVGLAFSALFGLLIWLWSVILFALALVATYNMSAERVIIVLAAPFAMSLIWFGWITGFMVNIIQLAPPK